MTRLDDLHERLGRLRRSRRRFRWTLGYGGLATAALWALAAIFLADWLLPMDRAARLVLAGVWGAVVVWAFLRYTRPWLGKRETELDMALLVERQQHIDSDLVAALQFESPEAPTWGSVALERAVIEQVAVEERQLDVMQSLPRRELSRRMKVLLVTVLLWVVAVVLLPNHAATFVSRFVFGSSWHYPSRTHIEKIALRGGKASDDTGWGRGAFFAPSGPELPEEPSREKSAPSPSITEKKGTGRIFASTDHALPTRAGENAPRPRPEANPVAMPRLIVSIDPAALGLLPAGTPWWEVLGSRGPDPDDQPQVKIHYGQPARFEVTCSSAMPESGKIIATTLYGGVTTTVDLERDPDAAIAAANDTDRTAVYRGVFPRLVEAVDYQIYLGDAWTEPARIDTARLPVVDVEMEVIAPSYAKKDGETTRTPKGMRQVSVIEGSQVVIRVRSDKPLQEATIKLVDGSSQESKKEEAYRLRREPSAADDASSEVWVMDPRGTALETVVQPIRFAIQVVDSDGQPLERPIDGMVRILADLPPRVLARTNTPYVLPTTGAPTIYYGAADDHAIGRIWLDYEVTRAGGTENARPETGEMEIYQYSPEKPPARTLDGEYVFDLGKLGQSGKIRLEKDDSIKVTLNAMDYRGGREGKATAADPLAFQVTDELGLKMSLQEADKQTAHELKTMIQRQLGIGE